MKRRKLSVAPDPELVPDLDRQDPGLVLDPGAALVVATREDVPNPGAVAVPILPRIVPDPEVAARDVPDRALWMLKMTTMARTEIVTHDPGPGAGQDRHQQVPKTTETKILEQSKGTLHFLRFSYFLHLKNWKNIVADVFQQLQH